MVSIAVSIEVYAAGNGTRELARHNHRRLAYGFKAVNEHCEHGVGVLRERRWTQLS